MTETGRLCWCLAILLALTVLVSGEELIGAPESHLETTPFGPSTHSETSELAALSNLNETNWTRHLPIGLTPGIEFGQQGNPSVLDTLVLQNDTLVSGNYPYSFGGGIESGVYDPDSGEFFITGVDSNSVVVVNATTDQVVTIIEVPGPAYFPIFDSGRNEVFVAQLEGDQISVISGATNTVVATIGGMSWLFGEVYDSGKGEVFASDPSDNVVYVISDSTNSIINTISAGGTEGGAYDSGKGEIFLYNDNNRLIVISDSNDSILAYIRVGAGNCYVTYDSGLSEMIVTCPYGSSVNFVADWNNTYLTAVYLPELPGQSSYNPLTGAIFVPCASDNSLVTIQDSTRVVLGQVTVGPAPMDAIYDGIDDLVYTANSGSDNLTVVSTTSNSVLASILLGTTPSLMALDSSSGQMVIEYGDTENLSVFSDSTYHVVRNVTSTGPLPNPWTLPTYGNVAYPSLSVTDGARDEAFLLDPSANKTLVVSLATGALVADVTVGWDPLSEVYDAAKGEIFVGNAESDNISVISDLSNSVVDTIPLSANPYGLAYDYGRGEVFAGELGGHDISVINDSTDTVVAFVSVGWYDTVLNFPVYDNSTGQVLFSDMLGAPGPSIVVMSDTNNSFVRDIPIGVNNGVNNGGPFAYDFNTDQLYVPESSANGLAVISMSTRATIEILTLPSEPVEAIYDASADAIYVSNYGSGSISILNFSAPPKVNSFVAAPSPIDVGQTAQVSVSATGGAGALSYAYTGLPAGCTSSDSASLSCTPLSSGNFTVRVYVNDSALASVTSTAVLAVYRALSAGAISPAAPVIDLGQSVMLSSRSLGGVPPLTYQWYTGASCATSVAGANFPSYDAGPSVTTTYYYQVSDGSAAGAESACSPGDIVTVDPILQAGSISPTSPTIDAGSSILLTSNSAGGTPPYSYQWFTGPSCNSTIVGATLSTYTASPSSSTTYSYDVTDSAYNSASACSVGDPVSVNAGLLAGSISPANPDIDLGQSLVLTSHTTGGTSPYLYQWFQGAGCTAPIIGAVSPTLTVSPSTSETYSFEVSDSASVVQSACSTGDLITVDPALIAGAISPASAILDQGQSITLTATPSGGVGSLSIRWYSGPLCSSSIPGANSVTYSVTPSSTTTFSYSVTDSSGAGAETQCSASDTITVDAPLLAGGITPSSIFLDVGESVLLNSTPSGGTPGLSIQWFASSACGQAISGATGPTYLAAPLATTTYSYRATDQATAPETACSPGDTVTVNSPLIAGAIHPSSPIIENGQTVALMAQASGGTLPYAFQWYNGPSCSLPIPLAISLSYAASPTATSTFSYSVTDSAGTPETGCSPADTVKVIPALAIESLTAAPSAVRLGGQTTISTNLTGGLAPISIVYVGLPSGCSSSNSLVLDCVPVNTGTFSVRVYANDSLGVSETAAANIVVFQPVTVDLTSVELSPESTSLVVGGSTEFTALPSCSSSCSSGVTYQWSLNSSLGSVSPGPSGTATFVAGHIAGTVMLSVVATLNGTMCNDTALIQILSSSGPVAPSGAGGLSGALVTLSVVCALVVLLVVMLLVSRMKRRGGSSPKTASAEFRGFLDNEPKSGDGKLSAPQESATERTDPGSKGT